MKALTLDKIHADQIKLTPELLLLLTPLTFVAGNWYISAISLLAVLAYMLLRYFRFSDHEFTIPNIIPWMLMLGWGLYVCYITPDPVKAVKYYTGTILLPFLIFIIFDNIRIDKKILTHFIDAMLVSAAVLGMYSVYIFFLYNMRAGMRVPSFWNDFNMVALYFMIAFMFNLTFLLKCKNNSKKIFYIITLIFILLGVYLTKTRGVWLAMIFSFAVFFIKRPKIIIPTLILFGILVLVFFNIIEDRVLSIINFEQDKSSLGRLQAWTSTVMIILKNPFLGYGFDTYYLHQFDVMAYYIVDVPHPHNAYLRTIQEMGLIGTVFYYYLIMKALFYSFNFGNYVSDPEYVKFTDALQLCLVAFLVAFNFEPYLSLFGVTTIAVWTIVALTFRIRKEARLIKAG
ncbi:MAG TPA: O-antigen ligase family protein [Ignavibacteria bacterium]|nr:O-antigen ligase family protein [Ignavibacteria bacterium]HMR39964.1 O-antigen ligase family protein [Ignavibacteria bacterium]